jgi:hypothetical protein
MNGNRGIVESPIRKDVVNRRLRRRGATVVGAMTFTLGFVPALVGIGVAPVAHADPTRALSCKPKGEVSVHGAEARWTKCIGDGWTSVDGWVKDTRKDGKCAQVYTRFTNGAYHESESACPEGTVHRFTWREPASDASVFLRTVG